MAIATKQQEREALNKIKKIVEDLGENSYVGTALQACFDDAEQNIENDWALSMYDRWQYVERNYELEKAKARELDAANKKLEEENKRLSEQVERLQEWKPYEDTNNVSQMDYDKLAAECEKLNDEEAIKLICKEFGFAPERVEILHKVNIYEINKARQLRKIGEVTREPLYFATDMNYVRFNVCGSYYEILNGELRFFID